MTSFRATVRRVDKDWGVTILHTSILLMTGTEAEEAGERSKCNSPNATRASGAKQANGPNSTAKADTQKQRNPGHDITVE